MTFEQFISIFANLVTIFGSGLAFWVFWTWKNQQNYSFARDKIFECELIVNELQVNYLNYITYYYNYVLKGLNHDEINPLIFKNELAVMSEQNKLNLINYDKSLGGLTLLDIQFNDEILINRVFFEDQCQNYLLEIDKCTETKELVTLFWTKILPEMQKSRKVMLQELKLKREKL